MPIETAQRRVASRFATAAFASSKRSSLPNGLRAGIETLSGLSMDQVKVHYGSPEPSRLQAHAFTRGTDIHLGPGQEHHLAHEAWHVVQQAEGRVRPTMKLGTTPINDDDALEREADRRGSESAAHGARLLSSGAQPGGLDSKMEPASGASAPVQRMVEVSDGAYAGTYKTKGGGTTATLVKSLDTDIGDELSLGWKGWLRDEAAAKAKTSYTSDELVDKLKQDFPAKTSNSSKVRPNFPKSSYWAGTITREIQTGKDQSKFSPSDENQALPHRSSFNLIKNSTDKFITGKETDTDLDRWSDRLVRATKKRRALNVPKIKDSAKRKKYEKTIDDQLSGFETARKKLKSDVASGTKLDLTSPSTQSFLGSGNALHGNIPDYGPHVGVNIQVSDRTHLNFDSDGTLTPGSEEAASMTPTRGPGVAMTSDGKYIVTTGGYKLDPKLLEKKLQALIKKRGTSNTTIDSDDLDDFEMDT